MQFCERKKLCRSDAYSIVAARFCNLRVLGRNRTSICVPYSRIMHRPDLSERGHIVDLRINETLQIGGLGQRNYRSAVW